MLLLTTALALLVSPSTAKVPMAVALYFLSRTYRPSSIEVMRLAAALLSYAANQGMEAIEGGPAIRAQGSQVGYPDDPRLPLYQTCFDQAARLAHTHFLQSFFLPSLE